MMDRAASSADPGLRQKKTLTTLALQGGFALASPDGAVKTEIPVKKPKSKLLWSVASISVTDVLNEDKLFTKIFSQLEFSRPC